MTDPPTRRAVLASLSAGLIAGLAGCSGRAAEPEAVEPTTRLPDTASGTKTGGSCSTGDETTATTRSRSDQSRSDQSRTAPEAATTTPGGTPTTTERPSKAIQQVRFWAASGGEVVGILYPAGPCAVVLVPQVNLDRRSWDPQARALRAAGYTALAIDERPDARADSALGAVQFLHALEWVERVVLVGASTGGEAVVRANARAEPGAVAGTVALSPAGGEDVATDLQGRLLVAVSEGDEDRFVRTARALHERAPEPRRLVVFGGDAHGQRLFESRHGPELLVRTTSLVADVCEAG